MIRSFAALILVFLLSSAAGAQERVKVGLIVPVTGPFARYGERLVRAVEGVKPPFIDLIVEDEGCAAAPALKAYYKLSQFDRVKFYLGPACGSSQIAVAQQLKKHDQLAIVGNSAPVRLHAMSGGKIFSAQHTIEAESEYLAEQVNRRYRRLAVVFYDNEFSRAHEAAFRRVFNGEISHLSALTSHDATELRAFALKAKEVKAEAIYSPDAWPLLSGLMQQLAAIGLPGIPVYAVSSAQSQDVLDAVGGKETRLIYSYPDVGGRDALEYFGERAAIMLFSAIGKCGENPDCAREHVRNEYHLSSDGAPAGKFVMKTVKNGGFASR